MNTEKGAGGWGVGSWSLSGLASLMAQSILNLSIVSFVNTALLLPANSIDRRYHYILPWKMASKYMTFVTWCMLHYRADIALVWVLESYKSHLFFPSLPLSTNVLGCHSCVWCWITIYMKCSKWVGTYPQNICLYYALCSLGVWSRTTPAKLWIEVINHRRCTFSCRGRQPASAGHGVGCWRLSETGN